MAIVNHAEVLFMPQTISYILTNNVILQAPMRRKNRFNNLHASPSCWGRSDKDFANVPEEGRLKWRN